MPDISTPPFLARRMLACLADTEMLAGQLADIARSGDLIVLSGDLGAGKTALARALIRRRYVRAGLRPETVSSPTFNLVQIYDPPPCPIWHLDLYRLQEAGEAEELGWEDARSEAIVLIEWPQRLSGRLPTDHLAVSLDWADPPGCSERRSCVLSGGGDWPARLAAADTSAADGDRR